MFARVNTVKRNGRTYQYLQILESFHDQGRSRHRLVANLGRLDQLGESLDKLVESLAKFCLQPMVGQPQIQCEQALMWGPVGLARHLWEQVQLGQTIGALCRSRRRRFEVSETAFVLVANRLCEPGSEHGLARWLEHTFVCDGKGRRWKPQWRAAKQQRVKVRAGQLNQWYRTLDALLAVKPQIEEALYLRVRDLFNLKVDMVFYDLTSTYFCYRSPKGRLRRHGASKDGKPRQVQVMVGVVMANGFPIAHHVFPGNTADKKTLAQVLTDLEERFGLDRVMVVADRGFISPDNLQFLANSKYRYLWGQPGRRSAESAQVLEALDEEGWQRVDDTNQVQQVSLPDRSIRYFVIDSDERKAYEQLLRERSMQRARASLEKVAAAVRAGRIKDPAVIAARATRAMSRNHGQRYYTWKVAGPGQFEFFEDDKKMQAELRREGKYILKSDDTQLTGIEAVRAYKQLHVVEEGFRDLKDVLAMRPIYHQTDRRIVGHLFVATLALFLKRTLEYQLARTLPDLSGTDAIAAMRSIGLVELDLAGKRSRLVSQGGRDARRIVQALQINDLAPPGTPQPPAPAPEPAK